MPSFPEIIEKKRDGHKLSESEITWAVSAYAQGEVPDYQMSALLMAIYFRDMDREETAALAKAMIASGDRVDFSDLGAMPVDKHSTGGVGDKVSLVLAPLVAACGVPVPMMSGRGLGHSGGTLDKLEAIPGLRVRIPEAEARSILKEIGFVMMGQTDRIVPADRKMYALRDVTGTVPSVPLICGSILSKKTAEGTQGLVLDVKIGDGAFLKTREETIRLAESLVDLGNDLGLRTVAQLTAMNEPLGMTVGNWLETREALDCLRGHGPADVMEVTMVLSAQMLVLGGAAATLDEARDRLQTALRSGKALALFRRMVALQGGDVAYVDAPEKVAPPAYSHVLKSPKNGFVASIHGRETGWSALMLGAGRRTQDDVIDPGAGLIFNKKVGDAVQAGEPLVTLYTSNASALLDAAERLSRAIAIADAPPEKPPLIDRFIDPAGWIAS